MSAPAPNPAAASGRLPALATRARGAARGLAARALARLVAEPAADSPLEQVLDLLEEHVYAGALTADGRYINHYSGPTFARFIGAPRIADADAGALWESRILAEDWAAYERFNQTLMRGEPAEVRYRLRGLDGVTRTLWDRARRRPGEDGRTLVHGIISDVSRFEEANARAAEASARFARLLDIVGEHVYLALAHPDGRLEELFQGPGADRLLGGAEPDAEMENWDAAVHPDDRAAYEAFLATCARGLSADIEYRLIGADGVTRWVHDRASARPRDDGIVEVSGIVSDVTERRQMREELTRTHQALSRVVEAMDDHLYTLRAGADGRLHGVYHGPNHERLAGGVVEGASIDEVWERLVHPDDRELRRAALASLRRDEPLELEYRVIGLDGVERVVLDRLRPRRDADGALCYDGIARDVTQRRRLEEQLRRSVEEMRATQAELELARGAAEERARTDDLTGAFNRRHFAEVLAHAAASGVRGRAVLLFDADHFKQVNDGHGHAVGDEVLVELVRRVQACLGPGECLARWGGEEFAVLLVGVASDLELAERAERLRLAVAETPIEIAGGGRVPITISIGAARAAAEASDARLLDVADRCLYVAKRDGRDRVSLQPHLPAVPEPVRPVEAGLVGSV